MARKFDYSHNNFKDGELGPKSKGDISKEAYYNGLDLNLNALPMSEGGNSRRPGTRIVRTIPVEHGLRLIEFVFSKTEAFAVGIDDQSNPTGYDFYITQNDGTEFGITNAFGSGTLPVVGVSDITGNVLDKDGLHWVQQGDQIIFVHESREMRPFILNRTPAGFEITPWGFGRVQTNMPFQVERVGSVCSPAQLVGENLPGFPNTLLTYPYTDPNIDPDLVIEIRDSVISERYEINFRTENADTRIFDIFNDSYVGEFFKVTVGAAAYVFRIDAINNFTGVSVCDVGDPLMFTATVELLADGDGATQLDNVLTELGGVAASSNWQEQEWGSRRGWPGSVTIYEQRLVFGGTLARPDSIWQSQLGNIYRFKVRHLPQDQEDDISGVNYVGETNTDDPFTYSISSRSFDRITWLQTGDTLQVGTLGAEYIVSGHDELALANNSISIRKQTGHGSSPVRPAETGNSTMFVSRDGNIVREFAISPQTRRYQAEDVTARNDTITHHLLAAEQTPEYENLNEFEVIDQRYSDRRSTVFLLTRPTRSLISVTLSADGRGKAWARHEIGGNFNGGPVRVDGVAVLPSAEGTEDEIWLSIRRTDSTGAAYTSLERIERDFEHVRFNISSSGLVPDENDVPVYLDAAVVRYEEVATKSFMYVPEAAGKTVGVLANGYHHRDVVVGPLGEVELEYAANEVVIGFKYMTRMITMPLEVGMASGQTSGTAKRIDRVVVRLYKSFLGKIGILGCQIDDIPYRNYTHALETDNPMPFSGNIEQHVSSNHEIDTQVVMESDAPYPFNVLNMTARGIAHD